MFINKIENAKYVTISGSGMFNLFKMHDTVSQLLRLLLNLHGLKMQSSPFLNFELIYYKYFDFCNPSFKYDVTQSMFIKLFRTVILSCSFNTQNMYIHFDLFKLVFDFITFATEQLC